jgi:hypothetical protein
LVCEKNVAISSSLTGGRPWLSDSQVFTPPNGCKNKKGRKYKVMLFAGRPRERGMGFVDDAERLGSVRIPSYIMHKTMSFTGVGSCSVSFVLLRTHGSCISSLPFYIVSFSITLFLITTYTIPSKIHTSVTFPTSQNSLGYKIDKNEMGGVCRR